MLVARTASETHAKQAQRHRGINAPHILTAYPGRNGQDHKIQHGEESILPGMRRGRARLAENLIPDPGHVIADIHVRKKFAKAHNDRPVQWVGPVGRLAPPISTITNPSIAVAAAAQVGLGRPQLCFALSQLRIGIGAHVVHPVSAAEG